jgi:plastocyanin
MTRRLVFLCHLVVGAAVLGGAAYGASRPPARVQVSASEYRFTLSRLSIAAGPAIVQIANFGEDPHDLRLQRVGGTRVYGTPVVQPGEQHDLVARLRPGTYRFWCSVADHRARGMRGTLVVRK